MARLSCSVEITRIILFGLNILFIIFGFTLLGFGIYVKVSKKFDIALSGHISAQVIGAEAIEVVGVILLVVGIFTVLLSVFGCIGTLFKNRFFLNVYIIVLIILMILELAAFITAMSSRVRIRNSYESGLWHVFTDAYENHKADEIKNIEELEQEFHCCGVTDYNDYAKLNHTIPDSCYEDESKLKPRFEKGCADAIIDWIWDELPVIGGVIAAVLVLEIFGVIASISLVFAISHSSYAELHGRL